MRYKIAMCAGKGCQRVGEGIIVNAKYGLCPYCNEGRLRALRKPKPVKIFKARKAIRKKFVATGEGEVFKKIWNEREHFCTNCKRYLGEEPCTFHFAHILSKKQRPDLRLDPTNITLWCLACHTAYDQGTKQQFNERTRM